MSASDPVWTYTTAGPLADRPDAILENLGRFYVATDETPDRVYQLVPSGTGYAWSPAPTAAAPVARVRAATTIAVNHASVSTTIDTSVTLVEGDRVLDKDHGTGALRGIYIVGAVSGGLAAWTRADDFDESAEVLSGLLVIVEAGTVNADRVYELTTDNPITLGTTSLTFTLTTVLDSLLMHLAGTETATGRKTFSAGITVSTGQTVLAGSNTIVGTVADKLNPVHLAHASQAIGDILYADGATTMTRLADVAAGSYLRAGGVATAPAWSTTTLPNTTAAGDLLCATAANVVGVITDVAAGSVLRSGGAGVVPAYSTATYPATAAAGDLITATASNVISILSIGASDGMFLRVQTGLPVWSTATLPATLAQGDILHASAANVGAGLAIGTVGKVLRSNGTIPAWTTLTVPDTVVAGDLLVATAANVVGPITDVATGQVLKSGGVGAVPTYGAIGGTTAAGSSHGHVFTGTAATAAAVDAFTGTGYATAGQVVTTSDNQTMALNQCAGMWLITATKAPCLIASNTAVAGAPAVLTVYGAAPATTAETYRILTGPTPVGTNAAESTHTHSGTGLT